MCNTALKQGLIWKLLLLSAPNLHHLHFFFKYVEQYKGQMIKYMSAGAGIEHMEVMVRKPMNRKMLNGLYLFL